MSSVYRIGTADTFTGQYRDPKTFIESLLGRLKIAARNHGWRGTDLDDAELRRVKGEPDMYFVAVKPGLGEVTLLQVRKMLLEKRKAKKVVTT